MRKQRDDDTSRMQTPLSPDAYQDVGYDELVTYAVYRLEERGEEVTFERMVAECFELFPARFHLRGYPQWPDSARVNKAWLRCRTDKGLLVGRAKEGFRLTPEGNRVAKQVEAQLYRGRPRRPHVGRRAMEAGTKEGSLIGQLERSVAFMSYRRMGNLDGVSEYDFRDALICTMDTPASVLNGNLRQFEDAARAIGRSDILEFLGQCRGQFAASLRPDEQRYTGGMMRRGHERRRDK